MTKPWENDWYAWLESDTDGGVDVYGVYTGPNGDGKRVVETDSGFYPPRESEAHLIAAAPQLYRVVDELVERFENGEINTLEDSTIIGRAIEALKKAQGE